MESPAVILWSLLLGGIALIIFELWNKKRAKSIDSRAEIIDFGITNITYRQSFIIGLCQSIAIIPGVSRSASTIVGGLLLGLQRKTIVEFSFLLAVPTMLVASGFDILKNASSFSSDQFGVLAIGFVTALTVAILTIKFFLKFIQNHTFIPFGIYRVAVAIIFLLIVI